MTLSRHEDRVRVKWRGAHEGAIGGAMRTPFVHERLVEQWRHVAARMPDVRFKITVLDPKFVRVAHVHEVLRGLREAGVQDVVFRSSPPK